MALYGPVSGGWKWRNKTLDLTFGTGGLRAVMGNGSHQMNLGVIREATRGVALYAREKLKGTEERPRIAIAYDSRHQGEAFARETARVLAVEGCEAWIYPKLAPTPALSFAVRYLQCDLGICITASHNSREYNGYKVYGRDGGQITEQAAENISVCIQRASQDQPGEKEDWQTWEMDFDSLQRLGKIFWIEEPVLKAFLKAALQYRTRRALTSDLKVVYTPLHGAGLSCVISILRFIGVRELTVVPEQARPDGAFPTCPYPNPEEPGAMRLGMQWCERKGADILLATDPDSDRQSGRDSVAGLSAVHEKAGGNPAGEAGGDYHHSKHGSCRIHCKSVWGTGYPDPYGLQIYWRADPPSGRAGRGGTVSLWV